MKVMHVAVALVGVAVLGWVMRDSAPMRSALQSAESLRTMVTAPTKEDGSQEGKQMSKADAAKAKTAKAIEENVKAKGARKCRRGNEVIYTNGGCPNGTREELMTGPDLSVVPPPAPSGPLAVPNVRDLLVPPSNEPSIREKQIDRVIKQ